MHEIKFRAWTGNRFESDIMIGRFGCFYVNPGIKGDGLDQQDLASLSQFNTKLDNIILEQFTGLHDATKWKDLKEEEREQWTRSGNMPSEWIGKEIYEGDIVNAYDRYTESIETGIIYFRYGSFRIKLDTIFNRDIYFNDNMEVIGNIHENPELLEKI